MKIKLEIDEQLNEEEVIVRCRSFNEQVRKIQKAVTDIIAGSGGLIFYKGNTEFYIPVDKIFFFETEDDAVKAHTADDSYEVHHRLYELEELLPGYFMRVSKSGILNINSIYSIERNISASSVVSFRKTHKQMYVSRSYFKALKNRLEEKRLSK